MTVATHTNQLFTLTPSAVEHIKHYVAKHQALGMRLGLKKSGCSGWRYDMQPLTQINADDKVFQQNGVQIAIAEKELLNFAGTEIDYVTKGLNKTLVFNNPHADNHCGCGESFSLK